MSGGRAFDEQRVVALCDYAAARIGPRCSDWLALWLFATDFEAYRLHGESITGATWMRGTWERPVYIRELGEGWFRRYVLSRCPWYARLASWLVTTWALARCLRSGGGR